MGFRKGDCLGKEGTGLIEPIRIGGHIGRKGLGGMGKRGLPLQADRTQHSTLERVDAFLDSKKNAFEASRMQRELDAARRVCKSLDLECGIRQTDAWMSQVELQQTTEEAAALEASSPALFYTSILHCGAYTVAPSTLFC